MGRCLDLRCAGRAVICAQIHIGQNSVKQVRNGAADRVAVIEDRNAVDCPDPLHLGHQRGMIGRVKRGEAFGDTFRNIEGASGSRFNDVLRGDSQNNRLFGEGGNDNLNGRNGNVEDVIRTIVHEQGHVATVDGIKNPRNAKIVETVEGQLDPLRQKLLELEGLDQATRYELETMQGIGHGFRNIFEFSYTR